jgi:hypothetical protein
MPLNGEAATKGRLSVQDQYLTCALWYLLPGGAPSGYMSKAKAFPISPVLKLNVAIPIPSLDVAMSPRSRKKGQSGRKGAVPLCL